MVKKFGLGKGLDALIPVSDNSIKKESFNDEKNTILDLDIKMVQANKEQPRKFFDESKLIELSESLKEHGIIQPLIVRKIGDGYSIIAGERRYRAAKLAGFKKIPAIIMDISDAKLLQVSLIENIQREDLNPIEQAFAYEKLLNEYNLTQEELSSKIGKSRSSISNSMRLLNLDERVKDFIIQGVISEGHGKVLLSLDREKQYEVAQKIIDDCLSVRDAEKLVKIYVNSDNDNLNERIADTITKIHDEHPDMGYRRIRDTLAHDYKIAVNDKRVLRICRKKKIQSYIKHRYNCCTKPTSDPAYVAENILNREFKSDMINQKWVTDVSEFKYGVGEDDKKGKLYLSVILDLCDRRPVAFVYSTRNDNPLVFDTFDKAVAANPGATPLLHSDRGYQYTSKAFRRRILAAGMTQSMSRVARCIDNGPMEGFCGLMKREMYYGKKYKTKEELMLAIEKYIDYYTNKRVQRNLGVLTPLEFHEQKLENVA